MIKRLIGKIQEDNVKLIIFYNSLYKNSKFLPDFKSNADNAFMSIFYDNGLEYSKSKMLNNGVVMDDFGEFMSKMLNTYNGVLDPSKKNVR